MKRRTFLPTLSAFCASLLLTVSCAQNTPEATAPADGTDTAETPAEVDAGEPVKLGYSSWAGWWPWAIAEEEGLFEENGANVELIWFDGYLESMQALASGQLDANSQTLNDTISFAGDAVNGMVAVLVNDNSAGNDKIIVSDEINTVADLQGKAIGLEEGVVGDFLLTLALEDAGLTREDVEIKIWKPGLPLRPLPPAKPMPLPVGYPSGRRH
jgi:NitT/TauT family transport system substrate-binding protein